MVFRRRSKATTEQLAYQADHEQYAKKYGEEYLKETYEEGEVVYSPLWDKTYSLLDLEDDWLGVEEDDDPEGIILFQPWEVQKV